MFLGRWLASYEHFYGFESAIKGMSYRPRVKRSLLPSVAVIKKNTHLFEKHSLSFLNYIKDESIEMAYRSTVWRLYILSYFAEIALNIDGDFLEVGVLTGNTAYHVINKTNLSISNKNYYLYDLFDWKESYKHDKHIELLDKDLYSKVLKKFKPYSFVKIIKGRVQDTFIKNFPKKNCFCTY